jgi:hypothetical protein
MENGTMLVAAFGLLGWFAFQVIYFLNKATNED